MKKAFTFFAAAAMLAFNALAATGDYKLVFSDEFDGTALNTQVWNVEVNGNGGGNGELQYYTSSNVTVSNGALNITAKRESYEGKAFTSGRINTMGKAAFKHGKIEASIKLPSTANGLWPAFWLMGNDMADGISWPYCGEMDVMEAGGATGIANGTQSNYFAGAMHWGPYTNGNHPMYAADYTAAYSVQDGEFHLYTLIWDEQKVSMYLDLDKYPSASPYFEMNIDDVSQNNSPGNYFHKRFFLLLNLAVGGSVPGIYDANAITAMNAGDKVMSVDYIRVYQKEGEENYITPDGSEGDDNPDIEPDETTQLGQYGSLALDDNGASTFDFENSYDYVIIGASNGVMEQMGDKILANYSVDDVNNYFYIWEGTYTTVATSGVNSFGLQEGWNSFTVGSSGWSGLGYASQNVGKDLSMIDSTYILHFAMRGTDQLMHTNHAIRVGDAHFTIGSAPFQDGGNSLPVLGDFKRDGRWCYFDIPVSVLQNLNSTLFDTPDAFLGNVFAVLSGGVGGAQLQFDNVFFYKNDNIDVNPPTEDTTTVVGKYVTRSLDDAGHSTFDFTDGYDYVVIGASSGVMDQMGENIVADYSVDDVNNFLWVWEGTYAAQSTTGINSFGLNEPWNAYAVTNKGWSGLGFASENQGKDLSMLDNSYYLHFAMKGDDVLAHSNHTINVGSASFVVGNTTTGPVIIGDYKRDGNWYSFDIPFSEIKSLAGAPFAGDGGVEAFTGNVFAVLSGGTEGTLLQFDNVFFYKKHSDSDQPVIDEVLGAYGSAALDEEGNPTFDIDANKDYVLIYLGANEAAQMGDKVLADYRPNGVSNFLWIWSGTYADAMASQPDGINSFGQDEGYVAQTVTSVGWSGLGFASENQGKDLSMLDETYYLHLAMKASDEDAHASHAVGVGNAHFTLGATPFVNGNNTYGILGDYYRDGKWYNFDIPYTEIMARANPVFDNPSNFMGNAIAFLSGGVTGTELNFDAIFFYRKAGDALQGDVNLDGKVNVMDVTELINMILGIVEQNDQADVNGDTAVNVSDVTYLINIILGVI